MILSKMGKKGKIHWELFILFALIALPFAVFVVYNQLNYEGYSLGRDQYPLFYAQKEKENILSLNDLNANTAFSNSLSELATKNGFSEVSCGGIIDGCAILNTKNNPEFCFPDISNSLNKFFSKNINSLNLKSGNNYLILTSATGLDYELFIQDDIIRGISLQSINLPLINIIPNNDLLGTLSFKPNFKIVHENELNSYPFIFNQIKKAYEECRFSENKQSCLKAYESSDDDLKLIYSNSETLHFFKAEFINKNDKKNSRTACFGFYLN